MVLWFSFKNSSFRSCQRLFVLIPNYDDLTSGSFVQQ